MLCKRSLVAAVAAMLAAAAAAMAVPAPAPAPAPTPSTPNASEDTALQLHRRARDAVEGRGYDDHHYMPATPAPAPPPPEPERGKADAQAISNYYEFLVNEGSFKFWAAFEIVTAALLIYSAFAAIYYAKYTYATTEYTDYDYFWKRSGDLAPSAYDDDDGDAGGGGGGGGSSSFLGISSTTFQRIMDAISSKKYS